MICNKCTVDKELSEFPRRKDTILGYRKICKLCDKHIKNIWLSLNRDKAKIYKKTYRSKEENKIKEQEYNLQYSNREYVRNSRKLRHDERYATDIIYKIKILSRAIIKNSINNKGMKKNSKTQNILGCSIEEFKIYLESKFESWMTWENHGKYNGELNYGWDIDHIIPSSSALNEEGIIKLNHYTNLQPLCSKINRDIKKNKF